MREKLREAEREQQNQRRRTLAAASDSGIKKRGAWGRRKPFFTQKSPSPSPFLPSFLLGTSNIKVNGASRSAWLAINHWAPFPPSPCPSVFLPPQSTGVDVVVVVVEEVVAAPFFAWIYFLYNRNVPPTLGRHLSDRNIFQGFALLSFIIMEE